MLVTAKEQNHEICAYTDADGQCWLVRYDPVQWHDAAVTIRRYHQAGGLSLAGAVRMTTAVIEGSLAHAMIREEALRGALRALVRGERRRRPERQPQGGGEWLVLLLVPWMAAVVVVVRWMFG